MKIQKILFAVLFCFGLQAAVFAQASNALVTTLAGSGIQGYADGNGTSASFSAPAGVAVDGVGNVYVADSSNNRIRKITPSGIVSTLAGSGSSGYADGNGTSAEFNSPWGVAVDGSGNVYVADSSNHRIRKITATGTVTTLAGSGSAAFANGQRTSASFNMPLGVAVDGSGNVYVADLGNHRIRKVDVQGNVTTLAGSGTQGAVDAQGTSASFDSPRGVAVDTGGNVYVGDWGTERIRKIDLSGNVTTLAGSGGFGFADGQGISAIFARPNGVAVDGSGNVYVADHNNHRIRKIDVQGNVTTLAGSGDWAFADGQGTSASFGGPIGVAVDGNGNVYVGDYYNNRIRKITTPTPTNYAEMVIVQGGTLPVGSTFSGQKAAPFHIGRFETTWGEWKTVRTWAAANGYDIGTVGEGSADNHPVRNVNWYDVVKWCNAKSEKEGLSPVYFIPLQYPYDLEANTDTSGFYKKQNGELLYGPNFVLHKNFELRKETHEQHTYPVYGWYWFDSLNEAKDFFGLEVFRTGEFGWDGSGVVVTVNSSANGYRLPSEKEWEWAARGGVSSQGYTYSGSNTSSSVAWDNTNSSGGTNAVGTKAANELGIYDMSGNVHEWNWDTWGQSRRTRGGSWDLSRVYSTVTYQLISTPDTADAALGFRYARNAIGDMVTVQGGTLPAASVLAGEAVQTFDIGRFEVTWAEWQTVCTYAIANGYDLTGIGYGTASLYPVQKVNWYDVLKWCNAKSQMENLTPVYSVNGTVFKTGQVDPTQNTSANGYRLPIEKEWEWAARGGVSSQGYTYSGSNDVNSVMWYNGNSSGVAKPVGTKIANELGIYDMSGNMWEWCWDLFHSTSSRRRRGGTFDDLYTDGAVSHRGYGGFMVNRYSDYGFRLARNASGSIDPATPTVTTLPNASPIIFGQVLSNSTLSGGVASVNGTAVAGSFAFASPATIPAVGNSTHQLVFTPTNSTNFTTATANMTVRVLSLSGDEDGDGLLNSEEVALGTNPLAKDTDADGVTDYREKVDGTDPKSPSSFDPLSKGLVIYYPFQGNLRDESGFGNDIVLAGGNLTSGRSGAENSALQVGIQDGAKSLKNVGITGNSNFTVSFWMKPTLQPKWPEAFVIGWGAIPTKEGTVSHFYYRPYSSGANLYIDEGYVGAEVLSHPTNLTGIWSHITYTYDFANRSFAIYRNGLLQTTNYQTYNMELHNLGDSKLYLGGPTKTGDHPPDEYGGRGLVGNLDDVRIYNRTLSEAEVSQLYAEESENPNMVAVQGGTLPQGSALAGQVVGDFQIGKYEVTWGEWKSVRDWAVANGYTDLANVGDGSADDHPVRNVNWYDVVKWCNAKSQMEELLAVYNVNGAVFKTGQNTPTVDSNASGYRLPSEKEWEWAARGGVKSQGYTYSGSSNINDVGWYDGNSLNSPVIIENGRGTWPVAQKTANELGVFDMSGNVFEWCWDLDQYLNRYLRGGGWHFYGADACRISDRSIARTPTTFDTYLGFRLARNALEANQKVIPTVITLPAASALVFGQALSNSTLSGGVASVNGTTVAGSFAFASPSTVPPVGNSSHQVVFTPADSVNYTTATANVTVSVSKAGAVISTLPSASSITFGQALSSSVLTGGAANVAGSFAFASPSTKPGAGNSTQGVVFTPTDSGNYTTLSSNLTVRVLQAVPEVSAWPSASPLKFGQALSASVLSGGSAGVAGSFGFVNPAAVPPLGLTTQAVRFTPADSGNYTTLSSNVTVTVDKAGPVISSLPTASAITEGQSLAASVLTGGSANVAGSFAFALPGTVPAVGNSTHGVVFSPVDAGNYTVAAGNVTVRVNALPSFSLNTTSTPGGNVTASAAGPHKQGSTVTLTAVPDGGFVFVRWAGTATGTANPLSLTVGGNLSVVAIFSQAEPADTNVQEFTSGSLLGVGPSGSVAGGANGVAATPDGGMVSVGDFTGTFQALGQNHTAGVNNRSFAIKHSANGTIQWAVSTGASGALVKNERVAVDAAGNIFVAGTFTGTVNFGPATLTAKGNTNADIFVAKLHSSNGTVQWVASGGGTNSETLNGLLAGADGEAYVTGGYFGANATFGSLALASQTGGNSNRDAYLGRISSNGTWQWVVAAGGSSTDQGRAVAVRDAGSLWWGGNFQGSAAVGPQQLTSQGATDIFVAAVDAASGNTTSPIRFGGTGDDALTALVSDRGEGFYASGSFASDMALGSVSLANSGVGDGFVARWQKNAGWTWGVALQGVDDDLVTSLAMDAEGRLYAGGYFASESLTAASNTLNNTELFSYDGFVARFTSVGGVKWLRGLRGDNNDYVRGVACVSAGASTGALHLVGYTDSALSGDAVSLQAPKGSGDAFFVRMNPASAAPSRTVTVNPSVGGTVSLSPSGPSYPLGTQVTLTPVPAAGFGFVRWGGSASGNATPLTITVNQSVSIDAEFADIGAPLVTVTSPAEGMQPPSAKVDFTGVVTDNVGVVSAAWGLNGVEKGNLTLSQNGSFSVPEVPLVPGDNLFTVVAVDAAGNEVVEEVLLVWSPARVFSLPATVSVNEGRTLKIPLRLTSEGGVGGFRLQVNFDPAVFSSANFSFTGQAALGESLWTAPSPGRVVLLTSLGGGSISSGIQQIGELTLRVRSVPLGGLANAIGVEVLDVSNNLGNPLLDGTGSSGCAVNVRSRSLPADINGNGFVDSGDGALLKTLIAEQDPARPWDVALNDLNATGSLDTGDLTKLLRIVVGFDPKPSPLVQPKAIRTASMRTMSLASMSVAPSIPAFFQNNGTRTPVEVRVSGDLDDSTLLAEVVVPPMGSALNSLEFELQYPADLLQIAEAQTAEAAPTNAILNTTFGTGLIRFTAFNNSPWATTTGGAVMRVSFTRISSAAARSVRHLITLENLLAFTGGGSDSLEVFQRPAALGRQMQNWLGEVVSNAPADADSDGDGMTNQQEFLAGTDPNDRGSLLKLDGFLHDPAKGEQTLTWRAKRGVRYRVQSSENLNSWISDNSTELLGNDGDVSLSIKPVGNKTKLFHRLQVVE